MNNPFSLQGSGISIPIYYLYALCCLILTVLSYIAFFRPGLEFRRIYCEKILPKNESCSIFDLTSYQVAYFRIDLKPKELVEFKQYIADSGWIPTFCGFIAYVTVIFFYRLQVNIRLNYYLKRTESSPVEFTVMVGQVDAREPLEQIYQFVCDTMEECGYAKPTIKAISVARADGLLRLTEREIADNRIVFQVIQDKMNSLEQDGNQDKKIVDSGQKIYKKLLKGIEKDHKELEKKMGTLKRNDSLMDYRNKNSAIFISFASNFEKEQVLNSYKTVYPRADGIFTYLCLCFCFKKRPKYQLRDAPQPDNINWGNVGYTELEKNCRKRCARTILILLTPTFVSGYMVLKTFESNMKVRNQDSFVRNIIFQVINYAVIAIFKMVTDKVIDALEGYQKPLKKTDYLARKSFISALLKYIYLFIGNFAFAITQAWNDDNATFWNRLDYVSIYTGGKVLDYMITTALIMPVMTYFDFGYLKAAFFRWRISRAFKKADDGNSGLSEEGEVDQKPNKYLCMTQGMIENYYERPEPELDKKYSSSFFMMLFLVFSTSYAPLLIPPLIALAILLTSLVEIGLFYNRYKPPIYDTKRLSDSMFRRLILVPKIMFMSYPIAYQSSIGTWGSFFGFIEGLLFFLNFVMVLCDFDDIFGWMKRKMETKHVNENAKSRRDYDDWKVLFVTYYQKENPCTASLGLRKEVEGGNQQGYGFAKGQTGTGFDYP